MMRVIPIKHINGRFRGLSQQSYGIGPLFWTTTMTGYDLSGNYGGDHCSWKRDWTFWIIPLVWKVTRTQIWENR